MSPRLVLSPLPAGVYILIGAGALIMVVGFLGCCGAVQESQCMLGLVSVPLLPTATLTPGLQDRSGRQGREGHEERAGFAEGEERHESFRPTQTTRRMVTTRPNEFKGAEAGET